MSNRNAASSSSSSSNVKQYYIKERDYTLHIQFDINNHRDGWYFMRGPGEVLIVKGEIHVECANHDPASHDYAVYLTHTNYLPTIYVHPFGNVVNGVFLDPSDSRFDFIIHKKGERFEVTVDNLKARGIVPLLYYNRGGGLANYIYVPEVYRKFLKGAVNFFIRIHKDNRTIKPTVLSRENLRYFEGELRIVGVEFQYVSANDLDSCVANDWRTLGFLIRDRVFQGFRYQQMPFDMQDLLDRMFDYTSLDDDERGLENHISLLSSEDRLKFIKNCSDKGSVIYNAGMGDKYLDVFGYMSNNIGWRDTFENIVHFQELKTTYDKKKLSSNYYDGVLRPAGGLGAGTLDPIFQNQTYYGHRNVNRSLIRCSRNMESHIDENCVGPFSDLDKDLMIMKTFERPLVEFHAGLCLKNLKRFFFKEF